MHKVRTRAGKVGETHQPCGPNRGESKLMAVATQRGAQKMHTTYCPGEYAEYTVAQAHQQHYYLMTKEKSRGT